MTTAIIPRTQICVLENGIKAMKQSQLMQHAEFELMYAAILNHHQAVQNTTNLGTPKDQQEKVKQDTRFYFILTQMLNEVHSEDDVCSQSANLQRVHHWYESNRHVLQTGPQFGKKKDVNIVDKKLQSPSPDETSSSSSTKVRKKFKVILPNSDADCNSVNPSEHMHVEKSTEVMSKMVSADEPEVVPAQKRMTHRLISLHSPYGQLDQLATDNQNDETLRIEKELRRQQNLRKWDTFLQSQNAGQSVLGHMQYLGRSGVAGNMRYTAHENAQMNEHLSCKIGTSGSATKDNKLQSEARDSNLIANQSLDEFLEMTSSYYPHSIPLYPSFRDSPRVQSAPPGGQPGGSGNCAGNKRLKSASTTRPSVIERKQDVESDMRLDGKLDGGMIGGVGGGGGGGGGGDMKLESVISLIDTVTKKMNNCKERLIAEPLAGFRQPTVHVDESERPHTTPVTIMQTTQTAANSVSGTSKVSDVIDWRGRVTPDQTRPLNKLNRSCFGSHSYIQKSSRPSSSVSRPASSKLQASPPKTVPPAEGMTRPQIAPTITKSEKLEHAGKEEEDIDLGSAIMVQRLGSNTPRKKQRSGFPELSQQIKELLRFHDTTPAPPKEFVSFTAPKCLDSRPSTVANSGVVVVPKNSNSADDDGGPLPYPPSSENPFCKDDEMLPSDDSLTGDFDAHSDLDDPEIMANDWPEEIGEEEEVEDVRPDIAVDPARCKPSIEHLTPDLPHTPVQSRQEEDNSHRNHELLCEIEQLLGEKLAPPTATANSTRRPPLEGATRQKRTKADDEGTGEQNHANWYLSYKDDLAAVREKGPSRTIRSAKQRVMLRTFKQAPLKGDDEPLQMLSIQASGHQLQGVALKSIQTETDKPCSQQRTSHILIPTKLSAPSIPDNHGPFGCRGPSIRGAIYSSELEQHARHQSEAGEYLRKVYKLRSREAVCSARHPQAEDIALEGTLNVVKMKYKTKRSTITPDLLTSRFPGTPIGGIDPLTGRPLSTTGRQTRRRVTSACQSNSCKSNVEVHVPYSATDDGNKDSQSPDGSNDDFAKEYDSILQRRAQAAIEIQRKYRQHLARVHRIENRPSDPESARWHHQYRAIKKVHKAERKKHWSEQTVGDSKKEAKFRGRLSVIGPHVAVYDAFHPKTVGLSKKAQGRAATVIQRWFRGHWVRVQMKHIKAKSRLHANSWDKFVCQYKDLLHRIQTRLGMEKTQAEFNMADVSEFMEQKLKFERVFDKYAVAGELEASELHTFFHDCGLYPSKWDVDGAVDLVLRGKQGRGLHRNEVLEVAYQIYPPRGTGLEDQRRSTWMNPIIEGEEALKLIGSADVEPTDFQTVWNFVLAAQRERQEREEQQKKESEEQQKKEHEEQQKQEHEEQQKQEHEEQQKQEHEEQQKQECEEEKKEELEKQEKQQEQEREEQQRQECEEQHMEQEEQQRTEYEEQREHGEQQKQMREHMEEQKNIQTFEKKPKQKPNKGNNIDVANVKKLSRFSSKDDDIDTLVKSQLDGNKRQQTLDKASLQIHNEASTDNNICKSNDSKDRTKVRAKKIRSAKKAGQPNQKTVIKKSQSMSTLQLIENND